MKDYNNLHVEEPFFLGDWFPPNCVEEIDKQFIQAIADANLSQVLELLQKGANPNAHSEDVPLLIAINVGNAKIVRALLAEGADPNDADDERYTVLMRAAQTGHVEIVQDLLNAGANINAVSKDGDTALSMAVWAEKQEVVTYLSPLVSEEVRKYAELYGKQLIEHAK